jgi:phenylalanyl-tRNA synthetase beta chain
MKPGDRVALALPGAELPGGLKIKKSKIRGVESGGMMCSEKELGLKDVSEGILILSSETPEGVDLESALGLADSMLEVSITPNRADLLSIRGLARELCAIFALPFNDNVFAPPETVGAVTDGIEVTVEDNAPCKRYSARVIDGVKIGPSPASVATRLETHGIRPINNVVDVTNYVLLATGQPLHAFDISKINNKKIVNY